jgi:hypothetical protein
LKVAKTDLGEGDEIDGSGEQCGGAPAFVAVDGGVLPTLDLSVFGVLGEAVGGFH